MAQIFDFFKKRISKDTPPKPKIEMPLNEKERHALILVIDDQKKIVHLRYLFALTEAVSHLSAEQFAVLVSVSVSTAMHLLPEAEKDALRQVINNEINR